jgi:hypothetical protein
LKSIKVNCAPRYQMLIIPYLAAAKEREIAAAMSRRFAREFASRELAAFSPSNPQWTSCD